jgi:hypothetical protein
MPCCPDKNVRRPTDEEAERFAREADERRAQRARG